MTELNSTSAPEGGLHSSAMNLQTYIALKERLEPFLALESSLTTQLAWKTLGEAVSVGIGYQKNSGEPIYISSFPSLSQLTVQLTLFSWTTQKAPTVGQMTPPTPATSLINSELILTGSGVTPASSLH